MDSIRPFLLDILAGIGDAAGMTYPGGKNGAGVYQQIINRMPPHHTYIEAFVGGGAVMRLKKPARINIGVDLDPEPLKLLASLLPACGSGIARNAVATIVWDESPDVAPFAGFSEGRSRFTLFHGEAVEFLERYAFAGDGRELIYCDPPYMMCSERSGRAIYEHEMSEEAHLRLLRLLRKLPAKILISGYWSALYADELRQWKRVTYRGVTRKGSKTEWLWYNFPDPVELHDYRYLGQGFRERERIKRKTLRWKKKLEKMPQLERQALLAAMSQTA